MSPPADLQVRTIPRAELRPPFLAAWLALDRAAHTCPCPRALAMTGGLDGELRVAAAWQDDVLVGVWPMIRTQVGAEGVLVRAGGATQVYDGPTLHPDAHTPTVVRALWQCLRAPGDVDRIHLTALPVGAPALTFGPIGAAATAIGPTIRVRPAPAHAASDLADGVSFARLTDPDARYSALVHAIGWSARGRTPTHAQEQLVSLADEDLGIEVFALQVDGVQAALQVALVSGSSLILSIALVDPDLADCGARGLLLLEVAAWCAEAGLDTLDLAGPIPEDTPWLGAVRSVGVWSATLTTRVGAPVEPGFRATATERLLATTRVQAPDRRKRPRPRQLLHVA